MKFSAILCLSGYKYAIMSYGKAADILEYNSVSSEEWFPKFRRIVLF